MNCHWNRWGFWWDEEVHTINCASWSDTTEDRIWSGPQCASYTWRHYLGCPLAQLLLSVPCRSGESRCLLVLLFSRRRCIRSNPRFHYTTYPWVLWTEFLSLYPSCFTYEALERAIRSTLSPPPGGIFLLHPSKLLLTPPPTPMYNGCFLRMLSKLSLDS